MSKLLGFDFEVQYKFGKMNTLAFALSRWDEQEVTCLALPVSHSALLEDIRSHTKEFDKFFEFEQKVVDSSSGWNFHNGLFLYKGKIFVPPSSALTSVVVFAVHNATHEWIQKTIHRLRREFLA